MFEPSSECNVSKQIVQTGWALTWQLADGGKSVEARLVAKGYQGPDLKEGVADFSGRVSLRSSHLQVISLRAVKEWELWSLDIKNAFLQADEFTMDVF